MAKKPRLDETKIGALTPDDRNANRHTERGTGLIEDSLRRHGAGRSVLLDKKGKIIAGNATAEAAGSIGMDDVILVQTDGTKLVAVQRTDLDLDKDPKARELSIADNRAQEMNLEWDPAVLKDLHDEGVDTERAGIKPEELERMLREAGDDAGPTELRQHDTKPPPKMAWVLIGIPTVRFGEIASQIEKLSNVSGAVVEIAANDKEPPDARRTLPADGQPQPQREA